MLAEVMLARADLIDAETLSSLSNDALEKLLREDADTQVVNYVIAEMLRRDLGQSEDRIVTSWPAPLLKTAIDTALAGRLHSSWLRSIPRHHAVILASPWLDLVHSTAHLAEGLALLRYPRNFNKTTGELSRCIVALSDDAQGTARINLLAFLLRAAIDEHSTESWRLISLVLTELRVVVLQGNLPSVAHSMLTDDLPRFYSAAYWDLNKRILLSLSRLYKGFPNETVLSELRLSESEIHLVVFGDDKERQSFFWNWF